MSWIELADDDTFARSFQAQKKRIYFFHLSQLVGVFLLLFSAAVYVLPGNSLVLLSAIHSTSQAIDFYDFDASGEVSVFDVGMWSGCLEKFQGSTWCNSIQDGAQGFLDSALTLANLKARYLRQDAESITLNRVFSHTFFLRGNGLDVPTLSPHIGIATVSYVPAVDLFVGSIRTSSDTSTVTTGTVRFVTDEGVPILKSVPVGELFAFPVAVSFRQLVREATVRVAVASQDYPDGEIGSSAVFNDSNVARDKSSVQMIDALAEEGYGDNGDTFFIGFGEDEVSEVQIFPHIPISIGVDGSVDVSLRVNIAPEAGILDEVIVDFDGIISKRMVAAIACGNPQRMCVANIPLLLESGVSNWETVGWTLLFEKNGFVYGVRFVVAAHNGSGCVAKELQIDLFHESGHHNGLRTVCEEDTFWVATSHPEGELVVSFWGDGGIPEILFSQEGNFVSGMQLQLSPPGNEGIVVHATQKAANTKLQVNVTNPLNRFD